MQPVSQGSVSGLFCMCKKKLERFSLPEKSTLKVHESLLMGLGCEAFNGLLSVSQNSQTENSDFLIGK